MTAGQYGHNLTFDYAEDVPLAWHEEMAMKTFASPLGSVGDKSSTQESVKYNLFKEHAKELGAKAAAAQVTDECKKLALSIKQEQ